MQTSSPPALEKLLISNLFLASGRKMCSVKCHINSGEVFRNGKALWEKDYTLNKLSLKNDKMIKPESGK